MSEVSFYHLTRSTLEEALPRLLERSLAQGWRCVVQAGSPERLEAIDTALWTFRDDSFLAHSRQRDGTEADQPVWLTLEEDNPNGAVVRILVDGAEPHDLAPYRRTVVMFDGHDAVGLVAARGWWQRLKGEGHALTYWQQDDGGGWQQKA